MVSSHPRSDCLERPYAGGPRTSLPWLIHRPTNEPQTLTSLTPVRDLAGSLPLLPGHGSPFDSSSVILGHPDLQLGIGIGMGNTIGFRKGNTVAQPCVWR